MNAPDKIRFVDPKEFAQQVLSKCAGDREKARSIIAHEIRSDENFFRAVMTDLIDYAASSLVDIATHNARRVVISSLNDDSPVASKGLPDKHVKEMIRERMESLFDMPMPGNKVLGACTRIDLESAAASDEKKAASMMINARWYRLIAKKLRSDDVFVCSLSEATVRGLYKQAQGDAQ